ncbi:HAMP domain-containing sensor histidine kinase [Tepidibacillus fermentans]|uniref:histidine kinase n=1 Tax=Tepidibacillus fermentans TaxID=1281767 RepID=A0A4R3KL16_9BACI|nr:HAMP domain-containing sensor histidine kinase [Tepidibacillus fermentans]TCS84212.1 HAMP domain-containing protein [Tepidibacillus fermentans]
MIRSINRISVKIGILFSGLFLSLLFLLGFLMFQLFTHFLLDYVINDLVSRGENHAKVLEDKFDQATINHVNLMERDVVTKVIITDQNGKILTSSDPYDQEMLSYLKSIHSYTQERILNQEWREHNYIVSLTPIAKGKKGFVIMYYPTLLLRETVEVLRLIILITSIGIILIGIGVIILISKKMTNPLLKMKEATSEMAKGHYKQIIGVKGQDELGQLGESIQKLGEQLQYYEDTRNEFLAGVSHELRTPLTYIQGYADILAKGLIIDRDEQIKILKIIHEETKRVVHLVNDLFHMAQIQTGQFQVKKEWVSIEQLLEKVVNHVVPLAHEKALEIRLDIQNKPIPDIKVDPIRMEQVFFNLIENAIKYTEKGKIDVSLDQDSEFLIITIQDTGIGIPKADLPRIWDRFYRVEKSRARKTGGSGLGLYLVKEFIRLHSGQIEVISEEGKGTTMIVKLPKIV